MFSLSTFRVMMLECYSTAGISITQDVLHHVETPELPRRIYTSLVLREKLENNAVKARSDDDPVN